MKKYIISFFYVALYFLLLQGICLADSIVGHWGWEQLSSANINNCNYCNNPSLCVGSADFVYTGINNGNPSGGFTLWNACKLDNKDCYLIAEISDGTWEELGNGAYKAYEGDYFYNILVKGDTATFASMSIVDSSDQGAYEFGTMFRNTSINGFKAYYEANACTNIENCCDGVDNDGDTLVDSSDPDCYSCK